MLQLDEQRAGLMEKRGAVGNAVDRFAKKRTRRNEKVDRSRKNDEPRYLILNQIARLS